MERGGDQPVAGRFAGRCSGRWTFSPGLSLVRQLQPWFENAGKRVVKSPKIYIRDSGLLRVAGHFGFGLPGMHPKLGADWEGFVIEQILDLIGESHAYFWATQAGGIGFVFPARRKAVGGGG